MKKYNKRLWLNDDLSSYTGSVAAYSGKVNWGGEKRKASFLEIADCQSKVKIHSGKQNNGKKYIKKLKKLRTFIDNFISFLEKKELGDRQ